LETLRDKIGHAYGTEKLPSAIGTTNLVAQGFSPGIRERERTPSKNKNQSAVGTTNLNLANCNYSRLNYVTIVLFC